MCESKSEPLKIEQGELERLKLLAEIDHLREQTRDLRRSTYRTPTFWISVATALVAIGGVFIQAMWSKNEYTLAKIEKEQAILAQSKAEDDLNRLNQQQAVLKGELATLNGILERLRHGKSNAETEIAGLERLRSFLSDLVPGEHSIDRFSPIPTASTPNKHLHELLNGWWSGAEIQAVRRVKTTEKDGWALSEAKR
jgi:hypothetical protein